MTKFDGRAIRRGAIAAVCFLGCIASCSSDREEERRVAGPTTGRLGRSASSLTAEEVHAAATVLVAHDHRLTTDELSAATTGGVSGLGIDLTVDGLDWDSGWRYPKTKYQIASSFAAKVNNLNTIVNGSSGAYRIARTIQDIHDAKAANGVAVIIGSEGVNQIPGGWSTGNDVRASVRSLFNLGWRKTQVWYPAGGCENYDFTCSGSDTTFFANNAITSLGTTLIAELNRTGVVIDLEHLAGTPRSQVVGRTNAPVLHSHEYPSTSGQNSATILQTAAHTGGGNGVIAIIFSAHEYRPSEAWGASTSTVVDVATELKKLAEIPTVGVDHLALGGDYMPLNYTNDVSSRNTALCPGGVCSDYQYVPATLADLQTLTAAMLGACTTATGTHNPCFTPEETIKILGQNLINLYDRVWDPTRGHSGGSARFYTCTNSSTSDECIKTRSYPFTGESMCSMPHCVRSIAVSA